MQSVFVSRERTGHGSIECAMRILLLALAVSAMGCGLTSYEKAAGQFGSATAAAVTATRSVVGSAHETCRFRAALHLVEARFQAPEFVRGTDAMALSSGVSTADGKGKLTWGEYCQQLTDYDRALIGALSALDAYASTLKSVAVGDGAAIQTGVAGALAADAGDLGNSLGASSLAKAKDLSGPVTDLANVVLDLIRTKKLKDAIRRGSGPVHSVLRGWDEYLGAAKLQLGDAERLRKQLVRNADAIIPVRGEGEALPRDLPGQALALYEFERLERDRVQSMMAAIESTEKLVAALAEAHAELAKGTEAGVTDEGVREFVAKKAQEIMKQVNVLRALSARG